jgi:2-hydroxychromene-2-carboxylate isomerase
VTSKADWYFDFISPFAYLQNAVFHRLPDDLEVTRKPVLFAGLLGHWEHKGPAELPPKRIFTLRYTKWWAERNGIPFKVVPAFPFHPIKALRLAVALGSTAEVVTKIYNFVWAEGRDPNTDWPDFAAALGLSSEEADATINDPDVKAQLVANGEEAAKRGLWGVPSFVIDGQIFWGLDATEMLVDYLEYPGMFASDEMRRYDDLPVGIERRR